jgi:hypothetical protein
MVVETIKLPLPRSRDESLPIFSTFEADNDSLDVPRRSHPHADACRLPTDLVFDQLLPICHWAKEEVMTEQDWLALGVTLFVMAIIGLILWLGLTGAFS